MKVVLAPDSFKENMTAPQAAAAMERGVRDVWPDACTVTLPMSDGGEGFVEAVTAAWGADTVWAPTVDALGRSIESRYGLVDGRAVMDVASCAGLELITLGERDVLHSSTLGLGMLIRDALTRGARTILLGIGGSATNDCGVGVLVGLGARLTDAHGQPLQPCPADLEQLAGIDLSGLAPELAEARIEVACDVTNPLLGPTGATRVFGPQKGVTEEQIPLLDRVFDRVVQASGRPDLADQPGAGAAGGLGFCLSAFLGARLRPGVELVAHAVGLAEQVSDADLVMTGEGSVDSQTVYGKTPAGVAAVASRAGAPCVVFAGQIKNGAEALLDHGVRDLVKVGDPREPLEDALRNGERNMRQAVADYLRDRQVVPER